MQQLPNNNKQNLGEEHFLRFQSFLLNYEYLLNA